MQDDKSELTVEHQWLMQCWDGCALTFWDTEAGAIAAFQGHRLIGHRAALFAPGIADLKQFANSTTVKFERTRRPRSVE